MSKIKIVLVDDHPLFLDGLTQIISVQQDFDVMATGRSASMAIQLAEEHLPDMILLDISMEGSGLVAAKTINQQHPDIKIVMLTVSENENDVLQALESGAKGYILKGVSGSELIQILRNVNTGEPYVTPSLAVMLLSYFRTKNNKLIQHQNVIDTLTKRERQVLEEIAKGLSNKAIASNLFLSEKTIKHHVSNIFHKLHVKNRVEAALIMRDNLEDKR